jgi:hypothetical protein
MLVTNFDMKHYESVEYVGFDREHKPLILFIKNNSDLDIKAGTPFNASIKRFNNEWRTKPNTLLTNDKNFTDKCVGLEIGKPKPGKISEKVLYLLIITSFDRITFEKRKTVTFGKTKKGRSIWSKSVRLYSEKCTGLYISKAILALVPEGVEISNYDPFSKNETKSLKGVSNDND